MEAHKEQIEVFYLPAYSPEMGAIAPFPEKL